MSPEFPPVGICQVRVKGDSHMSARFMIAKKWLKQSTHVTSSGLRFVRYSFCVLFALSILTLNPESVLAASDASVSTKDNNIENELTAFDKEAITSIR